MPWMGQSACVKRVFVLFFELKAKNLCLPDLEARSTGACLSAVILFIEVGGDGSLMFIVPIWNDRLL